MRLDSALKKSCPRYISAQKILTLFWCTGWAWNWQIIFRFTSIHGRACFILYCVDILHPEDWWRSIRYYFVIKLFNFVLLLFLYQDHLITRKSLLTWVLLNLQLHMQSKPNTTNSINSNSTWVYSIQHYVIKFVSDLQQVGDFLWVLWFPPSNKADVHEYENIVESGIKPFCNKIKLFSYLVT